MENKLLELEKQFFQIKYISNKKWLEEILHEHFIECGKSGYLYDKKDTINALLDCQKNREIVIYNYSCEAIDSNSWIVHYVTKTEHHAYYRTSIWVKTDILQLRFHQATIYKEQKEWIEF